MARAENFANAIFHDLRYDIDQQAEERTTYRLNAIQTQYGAEAVFGILATWAWKSFEILQAQMPRTRHADSYMVPFIEETLDLSSLPTDERARISGLQFVNAVATDDLETAEAIFLAAKSSSVEDVTALVTVVLMSYINISDKYLGKY